MNDPHAHRWFDADAEKAVLAAPLLVVSDEDARGRCSNGPLRRMAPLVTAKDFHDPNHALIWSALVAIDGRGEPIDLNTLSAELRTRERLNTVGGMQYLGELTDAIPTVAHCEAHARVVAKMARVRRRREAHARALLLVDGGHRGLDETLTALDAVASGLTEQRPATGTSAAEHADAAIEFVMLAREARATKRTAAARFGVEALDGAHDGTHGGLLGGLLPGRVITVSAPPAAGKTTLATQAAIRTALDGGRVLWASTEIPGREIAIRYACQSADPPVSQVDALAGCLDDRELHRVVEGLRAFKTLPINIFSEDLSIDAIAATVSAACAESPVRLVVVDYFQDLEPSGLENETAEQKHRARIIKAIARNNNVPVLVVSSVTKDAQRNAGNGKRATSANLFGAGIAYASDVVIEITRTDPDDEGDEVGAELAITKARYGKMGRVQCVFDMPRGVFREQNPSTVDPDEAQPGRSRYAPPARAEEYGPPDVDESFGRSYGDAE